EEFERAAAAGSGPRRRRWGGGIETMVVVDLVGGCQTMRPLRGGAHSVLDRDLKGAQGCSGGATRAKVGPGRWADFRYPGRYPEPYGLSFVRKLPQMRWFNITNPVGMMKAGRVRALAIAAEQRLSQHADVPTLAEVGFPGMRAAQWVAAFAPSAVAADVVETLRK